MKIKGVEINGFGVWRQLCLDKLSGGITVFYGPNEAGKTTLLQFVRTMLFGVSTERQHRYLQAVSEERPGGTLTVELAEQEYRLERFFYGSDVNHAQLAVTNTDGSELGQGQLANILQGVDEPTFNNVFAIGLEELQRLGCLDDTDAATLLYELSTGLDRVSLGAVLRDLRSARDATLGANGHPDGITGLLDQRQRLQAKVAQHAQATRQWTDLLGQAKRIDQSVTQLDEKEEAFKRDLQTVESALSLSGKWQERRDVDAQLKTLGTPRGIPEDAVERIERFSRQIRRRRKQQIEMAARRRMVVQEARRLKVRERLWRDAARIEALAEQRPWIASIERKIREAEAQLTDLDAQSGAERQRLGVEMQGDSQRFDGPAQITRKQLTSLRPPARNLRHAEEQVTAAERAVQDHQQATAGLQARLNTGATDDRPGHLMASLDAAGESVTQLRRRMQLEVRLDQLARSRTDLQEQSDYLLDRQLMPTWILASLGCVFALGVAMLLAGLFLPVTIVGTLGRTFALLGILGTAVAGMTKFILEHSATNQLNDCQNQLEMVERQVTELTDERDQLDQQLPRGGGPLAVRLQAAERELAELEALLPVENQRQSLARDAEAAAQDLAQAQASRHAAQSDWQQALTALDLPPDLTPNQVRHLSGQSARLGELNTARQRSIEQLEHYRREYEVLQTRIAELAAAARIDTHGRSPNETLDQLLDELKRVESKVKRRKGLRRRYRRLRKQESACMRLIQRMKRSRRNLMRRAGVESLAELRKRALVDAHIGLLTRQRESLTAEIDAALESAPMPDELMGILESRRDDQLTHRKDSLDNELGQCRDQLLQMVNQRGAVDEQLRLLEQDSKHSETLLELSQVDRRIEQIVERWQVEAAAWLLLDTVRRDYEQHRQPETLVEASQYLGEMTEHQYVRVWTPFDEDVLYVDDCRGQTLPVESLSRGTREQLFLSLRLALVAFYGRLGRQLPMVLDDVLVNFDEARAKLAVRVLKRFAQSGHQVLLMTCHRHISKMFKSAGADIRTLPSRAADEPLQEALPARVEPEPPAVIAPPKVKAPPKAVRSPEVPESPEVIEEPTVIEPPEADAPPEVLEEPPVLEPPQQSAPQPVADRPQAVPRRVELIEADEDLIAWPTGIPSTDVVWLGPDPASYEYLYAAEGISQEPLDDSQVASRPSGVEGEWIRLGPSVRRRTPEATSHAAPHSPDNTPPTRGTSEAA